MKTTTTEILIPTAFSRAWWPRCARCNKLVEEIISLPNEHNNRNAVREYIVKCHGEFEKKFIGIWAAFEIATSKKRLPDAFTK